LNWLLIQLAEPEKIAIYFLKEESSNRCDRYCFFSVEDYWDSVKPNHLPTRATATATRLELPRKKPDCFYQN
jgi:hypothetical protein